MAVLARAIEDAALGFVRRWWRPLICAGVGGSLIANGILIPLMTRTGADLTGLAALVVAVSPFAWLRTREKTSGAVT